MTASGYIRAYRSIFESWEHRNNPLMVAAWLYILAHTAYTETQDDGVTLHPGEVILSRRMLAEQYELSINEATHILRQLMASGEIEVVSNLRKLGGCIYRVAKWETYNQNPNNIPINVPKNIPINKEENGEVYPNKIGIKNPNNIPINPENPTSTEGARVRTVPCCEAIKKERYIHTSVTAVEKPKTADEVIEAAARYGLRWNAATAKEFIYLNRARGWRVGSTQVADWRYLIPGWDKHEKEKQA